MTAGREAHPAASLIGAAVELGRSSLDNRPHSR